MTLAEKILAAHCGREKVAPGDLVNVRVDLVLAIDVAAPLAIKEFLRIGRKEVFDPRKVVMLAQVFTPSRDIDSAEQAKSMREFAWEQKLIYFEMGRAGISHVVLPQQGLVLPGDIFIGADSHTCQAGALGAFATGMGSTDIAAAMATGETWMRVPSTIKLVYHGKLPQWVGGKDLILHTIGEIGVDGAVYRAIEFHGEAITELPMEGRFAMANQSVEAGAKVGLFQVDDKTLDFVNSRAKRNFTTYSSDPDAEYERVVEFDVSSLEPQVALPHLPSNVRPVSRVGKIEIDQVAIGFCTNGWLGDLQIVAEILKGRQVHPKVRCIIIPGSQQVYLEAAQKGLIEIFAASGALVSVPGCGPCTGGHMGVLAAGERCISTSTRNFVGRMGHKSSEVYLAGPAVAASSAILGRIAGPAEIMSKS